MTYEEIRKTWNEAARKRYCPTPEEFENMYREKKETALERLAARYRRFSTLGIVCMVLWTIVPFSHIFEGVGPIKWALFGVFIFYFALCSVIDYSLYRGVTSIDCFTMTVKEVAEKALLFRKRHLQSMILLIPFALATVGLMAYCFKAEPYMIYGIMAGAALGVVIGYRQFREFMNEYRIITRE